MMTPRQRWLALFENRKPDRVVTDYWATGEFSSKLQTALNVTADEQIWQRLGIDRPVAVGPVWKLTHHPDDPQANDWGIRFTSVDYGTGSYGEAVHFPLAKCETVADIHAFHWPTPDDYDYSVISSQIKTNAQQRLVTCGSYEPFLLYCWMRGMEQAFEDLLVNPGMAEAALGHIFDIHFEKNRRNWQAGGGQIDMMYLAEDLGGQTGPLFGLETYRRFFLPNQKKMAELARSFSIRIFYHTDGSARVFLPDLVHEVGINILNPLQWRCAGMELAGLTRDFGDKLIFHGGIDNQQTLPFGTVEDVRREVCQVAAIMRGYRWICAPCHNIQNVSPVANIIAMYEEISQIPL